MTDSLAGQDGDLAALFGAAPVFTALYTYRPSVVERETGLDPRTLRNKRDRGATFSHEDADAIVAFLAKHTGRSWTRGKLFVAGQVRLPTQTKRGTSRSRRSADTQKAAESLTDSAA